VFTGSPCFSNADVARNVSGSILTGTLSDGVTQVSLHATPSAGQISGTYTIVAGCYAGDTGSFTLTKV
jgi:hypothetical protein